MCKYYISADTLQHTHRYNEIIAVKGTQLITHTNYSAHSSLYRWFVQYIKYSRKPFIRHSSLFYFGRIQNTVSFHDNIYFLSVLIPVIIYIRLKS